ncbi:hypothetical protein COB52_05965 [Candidatus Kaiserbacteria bacterium]|nr:MAG: hypothetical protein COB52_05965 [Candidatus Kaiserbacteria bacterium]
MQNAEKTRSERMKNRSYIGSMLAFAAIFWLTLWLSVPGDQEQIQKRRIASAGGPSRQSKVLAKSRRQSRIDKRPSPFSKTRKVVIRHGLRSEERFPGVKSAVMPSVKPRMYIPAGTELMAIVDNDCVKTSYRAGISGQVSHSLNASGLKIQAYSLTITQDTDSQDFVEESKHDECLIGIADNGEVESDQFYDDPKSFEQKQLSNINAVEAEPFFLHSSLSSSGNADKVIIAIVDTGVDYNHQDLSSQMWTNSSGEHGFDFVNDDTDPMDDDEHGTHVAGLAAAAGGNNIGVAGVMPRGVKIMAVKVLDGNGSGSYANVANGIRWAVDNGADIINLSLSGATINAGVEDALIYAVNAGVPVIVSAGNDGIEIDLDDNARTPSSMGKGIQGVVTVGAIDSVTSLKSPFSNFSSSFVEIASPGSNSIMSTLPDNSFGALNGTSMSTPIVTGAAALLISVLAKSKYPYTPSEIENLLKDGSTKNPNLANSVLSGNQLNLEKLRNTVIHQIIAPLSGGIEDAF